MVWYCDNCGEKFLTESEGWVEWKNKKNSNNDFERYDLRLVHHKVGCQYNQRELFKSEGVTISDVPLEFIPWKRWVNELVAGS